MAVTIFGHSEVVVESGRSESYFCRPFGRKGGRATRLDMSRRNGRSVTLSVPPLIFLRSIHESKSLECRSSSLVSTYGHGLVLPCPLQWEGDTGSQDFCLPTLLSFVPL